MDIVKEYDKWHEKNPVSVANNYEKELYGIILNLLKAKKGKKLLDIACGQGLFLKDAQEKGLKTYGLDFSPVAIEKGRKIVPNAELAVGDGENLPYEDDSFDFVTCLGSLEHFAHPEKGAAEISRVLKKDGRAVIMLPNSYFLGQIWWVWKTGLPPDEGGQEFSERFSTHKGWVKFLEENKLKVIETKKWNRIYASGKASPLVKSIYNFAVEPFVPLNLSYAFLILCRKKNQGNLIETRKRK